MLIWIPSKVQILYIPKTQMLPHQFCAVSGRNSAPLGNEKRVNVNHTLKPTKITFTFPLPCSIQPRSLAVVLTMCKLSSFSRKVNPFNWYPCMNKCYSLVMLVCLITVDNWAHYLLTDCHKAVSRKENKFELINIDEKENNKMKNNNSNKNT